MSLEDIDSREPVLAALTEFDRLGREKFLRKYGFRPSRSYFLEYERRSYDSKAIVGAARGYARPDLGPLSAASFSGGDATVRRKLEELGFSVRVLADDERTSVRLHMGQVYTRDALRQIFAITDATLNTGVFRPKGTDSVWLFITEEKTADRTQYRDHLEGNILYWQGQSTGRTDRLIIDHGRQGLELLVFYRKRKYEFSGAGFRYLGPFEYVSHHGGLPTSFVLRQALDETPLIDPGDADDEPFDPESVEDARERIARTIAQRRGQRAFRHALIAAYGGRCAISGCAIPDVLEAAHIVPYRGAATNVINNGLLLRSDLHTLFDCGLIAINSETMTVVISQTLASSEYRRLEGRPLRLPDSPDHAPSKKALEHHRLGAKI
ncbi:DUF3427 domain-containing protein [Sinorhizobium meliloti]|uniref:DUF3427 domain-containing protein n=1 Tax=Rhizobium meliloti TaxID=382 RepID=UPI0012976D29|nr:DUF3427 domain-containing protein [Sinorhizobium meliloti]